MISSKGFSLLEIIICTVILGIAVAFILPNLNASSEQTRAQVAQSNLLAVSAAEQKYFEDYSVYCTATTGNVANCGSTAANLDANLRLSISDTFTYSCATVVAGIPYNCTAVDGTDTLTLNPNAVSPVNPVSCVPNGCGI